MKKIKKIRICFGSKEWFHKQFHLEENKLTFKEWKQKWQEKTCCSIYVYWFE
ncbi:hypothetical protein ACT7C4_18305 [Bacillus pacificus]